MPRVKTVKICKRCKTQFWWKKFGNSWRPADAAGNLHVCAGQVDGQVADNAPAFDESGEPIPHPGFDPNAPAERSADVASAGLSLWNLIAPHAEGAIGAKLSGLNAEALTEALARLEALNAEPSPIVVEMPEGAEPIIIEGAHYQTALLIKLLRSECNVMIVGPTQAGKTHACEDAAKALGLTFYALSVGPQTSKTDLLGYMDAHGRYQTTAFREAFEKGGLFLLDEIDAGNAGVMTILNAATSNGHCSFPDAPAGIRKHADFRVIAAANTFGNGADRMFVGRNQMDYATLKRFVRVVWNYDETLERSLSTVPEWTAYIHGLRRAQEKTAVRISFTTRDVMTGCKLLKAGHAREDVEDMILWAGVSADDKAKLLGAMRAEKAA